jgi:hypothetical protein
VATLASGQPTEPAALASPPGAVLDVTPTHGVQYRGIRFDASRSALTSVSRYVFFYGDGIIETSRQPVMLHGYAHPGVYYAQVVLDSGAQQPTASAPVRVTVRDGVAPTVRIDSPRPHQHVSFGRRGLLLRGTARDAGGVSRVELAIGLLALPRGGLGVRRGQCVWYDGRRSLVVTSCDAPYFFGARRRGSSWSFRMDPHARIPIGTYSVRVRARDRAGNWSHWFAEPLRTILPFRLGR